MRTAVLAALLAVLGPASARAQIGAMITEPGGSNAQVQYNWDGVFGGIPGTVVAGSTVTFSEIRSSSAAFGAGAAKSTFTYTGALNMASGAAITLSGAAGYVISASSITTTGGVFGLSGQFTYLAAGSASPNASRGLNITRTDAGTIYGVVANLSGAGAQNAAFYADASGASANYSFFGNNGTLYNVGPAQIDGDVTLKGGTDAFNIRESDNGNNAVKFEGSATAGLGYLFAGGVTKVQFNAAGDSYYNGGNVGFGTASPGKAADARSTSASPVRAYGWSEFSGARDDSGSIDLGNNASYGGRIQYDASGNSILAIDNRLNQAGAAIYFRTRTSSGVNLSTGAVVSEGRLGAGNVASPTATIHVSSGTGVNGTGVMKFAMISLGDDATLPLETNFGTGGVLTVQALGATSNATCIFRIKADSNTAAIISDPDTLCAVTDTDAKISVIVDGDSTYTLKNRLGGAEQFAVQFAGR